MRTVVTDVTAARRYFFYNPELNLIAETELTIGAAPAIAFEYIWFDRRPVAQVDGGTVVHWIFADHLGTPVIQTDAAAAIDWRVEYEPYGRVFALRTPDRHQPLRLPGQEAEQFEAGENGATERFYNIFRWYRYGWGRYTQVDPMGVKLSMALSIGWVHQGINPYSYAAGDPLTYSDPLGLAAEVCCRPAFWGLAFGGQHCFIRDDQDNTHSFFRSSHGLMVYSPNDERERPYREAKNCKACAPKNCEDSARQRLCFETAGRAYPPYPWAPPSGLTSNTGLAEVARRCCAGGFPSGLGWVPGAAPRKEGQDVPSPMF